MRISVRNRKNYKMKKEMMMSSNTPNSLKRLPANFRDTFGILKRNGEKYKDVIGAFIVQRIVSINDLHSGFLRPSKNEGIYTIHTDSETFKRINEENEALCVISFQKRTNGNFALIRLYKTSLSSSYIHNKETI
jgi:hypothetical protein